MPAVLVADFVGSPSTLSAEAQQAHFVEYATQLKPIIASHHGRELALSNSSENVAGLKSWLGGGGQSKFNSQTPSSNLLVIAHSEALDAIYCAVDIQKSIRESNRRAGVGKEVHLRIGIHEGEIQQKSGEVVGEGVALASRLALLGRGNDIHISESVYEKVKDELPHNAMRTDLFEAEDEFSQEAVYKLEWHALKAEKQLEQRFDRKRLAVLPFSNISPDPNDEYFADGMTEELITTLSQTKDLRVIARTSAMRFKGERKSVSQIGQELEVGSVVEGSVRKAGNRLRITVQLLDARTEEHLWSKNYDRDLQDVFAIQSEIAQQVADSLQATLLSSAIEHLGGQSEDVPVFLTYLKARALMDRRSDEDYQGAISQFELALKQDPNYAPAYAGLAEAWYLLRGSDRVGLDKLKEFSQKALDLDQNLADAHVAAAIHAKSQMDWKRAESEFKRAIALNPNHARAYFYYASCLFDLGRFEEARRQIDLAERADPLSNEVLLRAIWMHCVFHEFDSARAKLEKATKLDPKNPNLIPFWGFYNYNKRDYAQSLEYLERGNYLGNVNECYMAGALGSLYACNGKKDKAYEVIRTLLSYPEDAPFRDWSIGFIWAYLGNSDEFFKWALRAAEKRSVSIHDYRLDPELQYVREDPRWKEFLRKVNMES